MPRTKRGYSLGRDAPPESLFERDEVGALSMSTLSDALPPAARGENYTRRMRAEDLERAVLRQYQADWNEHVKRRSNDNERTLEDLRELAPGPHAGSIALAAAEVCADDAAGDPFGAATLARLPASVAVGVVDDSACTTSAAAPFADSCGYTFCLPVTKSRYTVDAQAPAFIPHADEELDRTTIEDYLNEFAWPPLWHKLEDPDVPRVQHQTALSFLETHTAAQINADAAGVLPPLRSSHIDSTSEELGLMVPYRARNYTSGLLSGVESRFFTTDSLRACLATVVEVVCPTLDCIEPDCHTHYQRRTLLSLPAPGSATRNTASFLPEMRDDPCGNDCFVHNIHRYVVPKSEETKDFADLIESLPDALPCHLATILYLPCYKVYQMRKSIVDPDGSLSAIASVDTVANTTQKRMLDKIKKRVYDREIPALTFDGACRHEGRPCNEQCICFQTKRFCGAYCGCPHDCFMRWKGCKCTQDCNDENTCVCQKAGRECDPHLCKCDVEDLENTTCQNASLQRGAKVHVVVRKSQWGFGAYASELIPNNAFVAEYLGEEMDTNDDSAAHFLMREYTHRNYAFNGRQAEVGEPIAPTRWSGKKGKAQAKTEYPFTTVIDAGALGNIARYLNHANKPNCYAQSVRMVNDSPRIGIFTGRIIQNGEELTLDYGEDYWKGNRPMDTVHAPQAEQQLRRAE